MKTMDFSGKRHSCLCLGKLPIQWQHHHSNIVSILDPCIVLLPHLLHCPMAAHASYENWSYHNGYGNDHGHFIDGVTYYPFYRNQAYYELNNYDTNPFLPSDCSDCIFISGLPKTIQKDEIISIFSKAGKIKFTKYGRLKGSVPCPFLSNLFRNPENILIPGQGNERTDRRRNSYVWIIWERKKCNHQVRSDEFQWKWYHISQASLARSKESLCRKVGEFIYPWGFRQVLNGYLGKSAKHVFIQNTLASTARSEFGLVYISITTKSSSDDEASISIRPIYSKSDSTISCPWLSSELQFLYRGYYPWSRTKWCLK